MNRIPIKEGLFAGPDNAPQLVGSRCVDCNEVMFPRQNSCAACSGVNVSEVQLNRRGVLWTWTIQNFTPPMPYIGSRDPFKPYGVGYVEFPEGVRVEGRLTEADPRKLKIGMTMEVVLEPFRVDDHGHEVMTFAFQPISAQPE